MGKSKPSTISRDPYADDPYAFIGAGAKPKAEEARSVKRDGSGIESPKQVVEKIKTEKVSIVFPAELVELARDVAYWDRDTLAGIVINALTESLERKVAERGEPYPPRGAALRSGRPVGSGKGKQNG